MEVHSTRIEYYTSPSGFDESPTKIPFPLLNQPNSIVYLTLLIRILYTVKHGYSKVPGANEFTALYP